MNLLDNHEDSVKEIYSDLVFDKDCNTAVERSIEAIKQISAITIVIEHEMCILYISEEISENQKNTLLDIFTNINNKSIIGVIIYNKDLNSYRIVNDGQFLNSNEIITFINNLNTSKNISL